ncbi:MucR family transcriptional regulator [Pseudovibrio ascidiaceicola]|uniref:MucR family transcriptional regulator n=1 Tax=Pseudovibrio ascidiaceicola TaxID=285279 RepID=UPI003D360435
MTFPALSTDSAADHYEPMVGNETSLPTQLLRATSNIVCTTLINRKDVDNHSVVNLITSVGKALIGTAKESPLGGDSGADERVPSASKLNASDPAAVIDSTSFEIAPITANAELKAVPKDIGETEPVGAENAPLQALGSEEADELVANKAGSEETEMSGTELDAITSSLETPENYPEGSRRNSMATKGGAGRMLEIKVSKTGLIQPPYGKKGQWVDPKKTIGEEKTICLLDGREYKFLKRVLKRLKWTESEYKSAFGLPENYPMVHPEYSQIRRKIAREAIDSGNKKLKPKTT